MSSSPSCRDGCALTRRRRQLAACACILGQLEHIRPEYTEMLRRVDVDEQPLAEAAAALRLTSSYRVT